MRHAGRSPGAAPAQLARVVLDPGAGPHLEQHLDVELGARLQPLRLQQLARAPCSSASRSASSARISVHRALDLGPLGDEVLGGVDGALVDLRDGVAGERIDLADPLDLVAPELDPDRLLGVGGEDLDRIAPDPEGALLERDVVPGVLDPHQLGQDVVAPALLAAPHGDHQLAVLGRVAQAVDGAHRGDDDHVLPLHQAGRGAEPEALDVLVDRRVLLDVDVGGRDVRLGLVVVVVADEVLDRVPRQELPQLAVELRGQRLVVGEHQRGLAVVGDGVRQRHRLARPGDAEQRLVLVARAGARAVSSAMALGWSPAGWKGAWTSKRVVVIVLII